jgi:hypothetical protein
MSVGHRVFIFTSEKVIPLSQKAFSGFFLCKKPTLKLCAGQIINVAMAIYKLQNRKPEQIITIDTMRLKVDENGSPDSDYMNNYDRLVVHRISVWSSTSKKGDDTVKSGNVVNAKSKFDQKAWEALHPKLPGAVQKQILDILFP